MGNMSYCRFENTARDLDDCKDALERLMSGEPEDGDDEPEHLSDREKRAAMSLMRTCLDVVLLVAEHGQMDLEGLADEHEPEETLTNTLRAIMAEADQGYAEWREKRAAEKEGGR